MSPPSSSREHCLAELTRMCLRARLRFPHWLGEDAGSTPADTEARLAAILAEIERDIAARFAPGGRETSRLHALAARFGLSPLDGDALLLSMLPAMDVRFEQAFAGLQGGQSRLWPTVDFLLSVLCSSPEERIDAAGRFEPGAPLVRHHLVEVFSETPHLRPSLLAHQVRADPRVTAYLLGRDALDGRLGPHVRLVTPRAGLSDLLLPEGLAERLVRFARLPSAVLYLQGRAGSGRKAVAEGVCAALGRALLVTSVDAISAGDPAAVADALERLGRDAFLQEAAVLFTGADAWLAGADPARRGHLERALAANPGLVLLSGERPWGPSGWAANRPFVRVTLPGLCAGDQVKLWRRELGGDVELAPGVDLEWLTGTYRLTPGQIREAARAAKSLAVFNSEPSPGAAAVKPAVSQSDLAEAARLCSNRHLISMGRKVEPRAGFCDLVLPPGCEERLREICAHVRLRGKVMDGWGFDRRLAAGKGVTALFSGPPGTGKTMAAGVLARELGLQLFHVDLSLVLSKYIGETEQHIGQLFDEAEASNAILFFDEADALFGKRTEVRDAHDRNANLEASYMLQRLEAYDGVAILASNLTKNMDEAFMRRFRFVVELPYPGEEERRRIWARVFPAETPLGGDVDLDLLARNIDLTGGHLRNVALCAAFFAAGEGGPVSMRHILRAARGEYQKMGRVVDQARFALPRGG